MKINCTNIKYKYRISSMIHCKTQTVLPKKKKVKHLCETLSTIIVPYCTLYNVPYSVQFYILHIFKLLHLAWRLHCETGETNMQQQSVCLLFQPKGFRMGALCHSHHHHHHHHHLIPSSSLKSKIITAISNDHPSEKQIFTIITVISVITVIMVP